MSLIATWSAGAATRLIGRHALGWTVAASLGAGSGYYAGSTGPDTGQTLAPRPAAAVPAPPAARLPLVPAALDDPALVEPQPPAS